MNILVLGLGVIGTTYACVWKEAGHNVEHFIREGKREKIDSPIDIQLLDGRENPKGVEKNYSYPIKSARPGSSYDFIIISISMGKLELAIKTLSQNNITGTLLLFCGTWENRDAIDKITGNYSYILGYPVAGGTSHDNRLNCVLFDHVMLENRQNTAITNYSALLQLLDSANMKAECSADMTEWIWIHMAINAAVISTAAKYADSENPQKAAEALMNSQKALSEAVLAIRETLKIVEARGVVLKKYAASQQLR